MKLIKEDHWRCQIDYINNLNFNYRINKFYKVDNKFIKDSERIFGSYFC
jgi:hypothetical protein